MSRLENIILKVRDTLADHAGERWPTDRLIRLVDEAQKEICRNAKLLRTKVTIPVYDNQASYKLPNDLLLLDRVLYNNAVLPMKSHLQLDQNNCEGKETWETETGDARAVVYDKQNRGEIKLYPIPALKPKPIDYKFVPAVWQEDINYEMSSDFGVIVEGSLGDTIDSDYGVAVDIDSFYNIYKPEDDCGCNSLVDIPDNISSDYGLVGYIATIEKDMFATDSTYGVATSVDGYEMTGDFGVVTGFVDEEFTNEVFDSDYGVLTGWKVTDDNLTVYYLKKPNSIVDLTSELEIDDVFDNAIKYYVTGKALRDDMDTQNRVVGNEELSFFESELRHAIKDDQYDFGRNGSKQYYVEYRGVI